MKTIKITVKSVYGNETIYPACERAQLFAEIAGTKTLTEPTLRRIKALGYEILVQQSYGISIPA